MVIRCSRCQQDLAPDSFAPSHQRQGDWCRSCRASYMQGYWEAHKPILTCRDCGEAYERWHNYKNPGTAGRRCHSCYLAYQRRRQSGTNGRGRGPRKPLVTHYGKPSGTRWRRLQEQVWVEESHCGICGQYVDQSLHHNEPMARSIDHIFPIALGGAMYERNNVRLAHRICNSRAGATTSPGLVYARAALWMAQRGL